MAFEQLGDRLQMTLRRIRGKGRLTEKDIDEILITATDEIGAPTNIATLAIILTMVPMAFVGGMMGSFMKPIPLNVPVALIASLFVAYIFTPYLSLKLLKKPTHKHHHNHKGAK